MEFLHSKCFTRNSIPIYAAMLPHCGFFVPHFPFEAHKTGGHLTLADRPFTYTLFLFINQDGTGRRIVVDGPHNRMRHVRRLQRRDLVWR